MIKIVCETSTLKYLFLIRALSQYDCFMLLSSPKVVDSGKIIFFSLQQEKNVSVQQCKAFLRRRDRPII